MTTERRHRWITGHCHGGWLMHPRGKSHYFCYGRSLCWRWEREATRGGEVREAQEGDCATCRRKFATHLRTGA